MFSKVKNFNFERIFYERWTTLLTPNECVMKNILHGEHNCTNFGVMRILYSMKPVKLEKVWFKTTLEVNLFIYEWKYHVKKLFRKEEDNTIFDFLADSQLILRWDKPQRYRSAGAASFLEHWPDKFFFLLVFDLWLFCEFYLCRTVRQVIWKNKE